MKERVLVCGAGGFVGGQFVNYLINQGYTDIRAVSSRPVDRWIRQFPENLVQSVSLDLRNAYNCAAVVDGIDHIYNFAAKVGGIGYIGAERRECLLSSLINTNLLMAAERAGCVSRYFYASSACVYGSCETGVAIDEYDKLQPSAGYGEEKVFGETMCRAFADEFEVRIARFTGIYGPGDKLKGAEDRDHVPAAICRKVIRAKIGGDPSIEVWGDGEQVRDFLYIDDCTEASHRIMNCDTPGSINVGSFETFTVNDIVSIVEKIAGIKLVRKYNTSAPQGVRYRKLSNKRLVKATGWEPSTFFVDGMRKTYEDILNEYTVV